MKRASIKSRQREAIKFADINPAWILEARNEGINPEIAGTPGRRNWASRVHVFFTTSTFNRSLESYFESSDVCKEENEVYEIDIWIL